MRQENVRETRLGVRKRKERRGGAGVIGVCRSRADTPADAEDFDEQFLPPGGVSGERSKGRWRRGVLALYRHGLLSKRQGIVGETGAESTATFPVEE
jgi:hypothetical protein